MEELIASHEDLPDDEEEVTVKTRSKKWIEAQYNKLVGKDIQVYFPLYLPMAFGCTYLYWCCKVSTVDAFQGSEKGAQIAPQILPYLG